MKPELLELASDVLGIPKAEVPPQLIYTCQRQELAKAITLRNAVFVLEKFIRGEKVRRSDAPWHAQYKGVSGRVLLIAELKRSGYLNSTIN